MRRGLLQCGRIYKDAEILLLPPRRLSDLCGFNVAASIKMRKSILCAQYAAQKRPSFNVAASIKMRKSFVGLINETPLEILQCGRIYKDAEMRLSTLACTATETPFNVAASIKMRK